MDEVTDIGLDLVARLQATVDERVHKVIGSSDEAIITVNERSSFRRARFSIAHELGHWRYHRGKRLICRVDQIEPHSALSPERVADGYAADLLIPDYLFQPLARRQAKLTFKAVAEVAEGFRTSKTATAIRLVESDHAPAVQVCHNHKGRKWFARAPSVPDKWFPCDTLDAQSFAFGVLFGNADDDAMPRRIGADAWFDRWEAEKFDVHEQSIRTGDDTVLTIVTLSDPRMLQEDEEWSHRRFR